LEPAGVGGAVSKSCSLQSRLGYPTRKTAGLIIRPYAIRGGLFCLAELSAAGWKRAENAARWERRGARHLVYPVRRWCKLVEAGHLACHRSRQWQGIRAVAGAGR